MLALGCSRRTLRIGQHISDDQVTEMPEGFHAVSDAHVIADRWQELRDLRMAKSGLMQAGEHAFAHMTASARGLFNQARDHAGRGATAPVYQAGPRAGLRALWLHRRAVRWRRWI